MDLTSLKEQCLVFDIETSSSYLNGQEININSNFEDYLQFAKVKFFGAYSFKYEKEYYFHVNKDNISKIIYLFSEHPILVGYNNEDFDFPICLNNGLVNPDRKFIHADCMKILCNSSFKDKRGFSFKNRGNLMGYKFKKNSLECVAETMGCEFQKSEIDYKIFQKDTYTEQEKKDILFYLRNDVMATKEMFEKLWNYWMPFTELVDYESVMNLSWIRSSIAALTYKYICNSIGAEATYSENTSEKEESGGRVLLPKYEESRDVIYVDFSSLYPHVLSMANLYAEVKENEPGCKIWHGNDLFKVKGYYDISYQHPISVEIMKRVKERQELKKNDPGNPREYALKITSNTIYGCVRNTSFEKVYKPNAGGDCCYIGRQIHELAEKMFTEFGFEVIAGDTDSFFIKPINTVHYDEDYVKICLKKIIKKINENVPFPMETFGIKIEDFIPYITFAFGDQATLDEEGNKIKIKNRLVRERKGLKKNYLYLYEDKGETKIKLVGLPLIKDTATPLSMKVFEEVLKPIILKERSAKFPKKFIDEQIEKYLKDEEVLASLAVEYKVKPASSYKKEGQIHAQISRAYFGGNDGVVHLIKNNKIRTVGKGSCYCSLQEAREGNLQVEDLDLEKTYNELDIFIIPEEEKVVEKPIKEKKPRKKKIESNDQLDKTK